jgi:hypothetical protein
MENMANYSKTPTKLHFKEEVDDLDVSIEKHEVTPVFTSGLQNFSDAGKLF